MSTTVASRAITHAHARMYTHARCNRGFIGTSADKKTPLKEMYFYRFDTIERNLFLPLSFIFLLIPSFVEGHFVILTSILV